MKCLTVKSVTLLQIGSIWTATEFDVKSNCFKNHVWLY